MQGAPNYFGRRIATLLSFLALLAGAAVLLSACGSSAGGGGTSTASGANITPPGSLSSAGTLTICSDMTFPPEEFMEGTKPVGVDIEIGEGIAEEMGVQAHFMQVGFEGIIAALLGKKCDIAMSSFSITPERAQQVDYVPYQENGQAILVPKGNPEGIKSVADLAGHNVAVQVGTSDAATLEEFNEKAGGGPKINIQFFPKDSDAAAALDTGRVEAYYSDGPPVAYYAANNPGAFTIATSSIKLYPWGIALRKNEPEMKKALTEAVSALYESGTIAKVFEKWNVTEVSKPINP
ncbi:MAG: ABC transporter substrate-binding protein [Actinobacteria bacterium]|nr:ABC transporter substrate-binding protein [Actinomycetota bacterium]